MFDTITGLPVHALVVHGVVVLIPLAAFGLVLIALRPSWRRAYGPLVVLLASVGLVMVPVATQSGERLQERVQAGGVVAEQIEEHAEIGGLVLWPALAMWLLAIVLVVLDRRRRGDRHSGHGSRGRAATVVAGLAIVAAVVAGGVTGLAGHLGSTAVWSCTIGSDACQADD